MFLSWLYVSPLALLTSLLKYFLAFLRAFHRSGLLNFVALLKLLRTYFLASSTCLFHHCVLPDSHCVWAAKKLFSYALIMVFWIFSITLKWASLSLCPSIYPPQFVSLGFLFVSIFGFKASTPNVMAPWSDMDGSFSTLHPCVVSLVFMEPKVRSRTSLLFIWYEGRFLTSVNCVH